MFDMAVPWWELMVRAAVVYVAVLVMVRVSGKRTIGQFSPFDVIVLLLLSEAAQGPLTGGDASLHGGLLAIATLIALNWLAAYVSARSTRVEAMLEGSPVTLVKDGELRQDAMLRNNIPQGDLAEAMRCHQIRHLGEVEWAVLEPNGEISFFKRALPAPGAMP